MIVAGRSKGGAEAPRSQQVEIRADFERMSAGSRIVLSTRPAGLHVAGPFRQSLLALIRADADARGFFRSAKKHVFARGKRRDAQRSSFEAFLRSPAQDRLAIVLRYDARESALVMLRGALLGQPCWLLVGVRLKVDAGRVIEVEKKVPLGGIHTEPGEHRRSDEWKLVGEFFNQQLAGYFAWQRRMTR